MTAPRTVDQLAALATRAYPNRRDQVAWLVEVDTDLELECGLCNRRVVIPPAEAVMRFGAETTISAIRERAKCRHCRAANVAGQRFEVKVGAGLRAWQRAGGL